MQALSGAGSFLSSNVEFLNSFLECTSLRVSMSDPYLDVHLPRLRCPRGGGGIRNSCKNDGLCPARTPRRRYGRLAAGAAVALFTPYLTSAIACQGFLCATTSSAYPFGCWPSQRSFRRSKGGTASSDLTARRKRRSSSQVSATAGERDGGDTVDWEEEETEQQHDGGEDAEFDDDDEEEESKRVRGATAERSESVIEELLLFFFQLDLGTRLQRALNQDQYEAAQQLREKIAEVEREVARQRASKAGGGVVGGEGGRGGNDRAAGEKAAEQTLAALRVRSDLQRAIDEERYADAARLRDRLREFQAESLAMSAQSLSNNGVTYRFRLGQRVRHRLYGYRGVVCGMDGVCHESEEWAKRSGVGKTERGRNQPFYHILGDMGETAGFIVTYVAEDHLVAPSSPGLEDFEHPYTYLLFYGKDKMGDYIPTKQLREKFNAPRYEVNEEDRDVANRRRRLDENDGSADGGRGGVAENDGGRNRGSDEDDNSSNSSISGSNSRM